MSDIVEAVAKAIWRQRVKFAAEADIDLSRDSEDDMIERNGVFEEARAAIEAYEAEKREKAHAVFGDVDKAVTEASATIPDLMRGLAR